MNLFTASANRWNDYSDSLTLSVYIRACEDCINIDLEKKSEPILWVFSLLKAQTPPPSPIHRIHTAVWTECVKKIEPNI